MIGGRRPISGRKPGDKRVRVERYHAPYFRYTGPNQLTAKAAASAPTTPMGRFVWRTKAHPHRQAAGQRGGDRRAPVEEEGAGDLQLRRDLVVGLRDRGDPARVPARRRGRRGVPVLDPGQHRDRDPARDRRLQLPPGVHRLPQRRRLVLGVQGEHRQAGVADRRLGPAHRLHADGRRLDVVRGGADRVRVPGARPGQGGDRDPRDRPDHAGQPPGPARGRQHLRDPDLPVPVLGVPDDRHRHVPDPVPGRHGPGARRRRSWRRCRTPRRG